MKRILVIDDEELTRNLIERILEDEGYLVTKASNGEQGLELFKKQRADLVITDMVMPVMDGLKTILALREIDDQVPVVAISGGGAIAKERYLTVAGYLEKVHAMAKPFSNDEIVSVVKELLQS